MAVSEVPDYCETVGTPIRKKSDERAAPATRAKLRPLAYMRANRHTFIGSDRVACLEWRAREPLRYGTGCTADEGSCIQEYLSSSHSTNNAVIAHHGAIDINGQIDKRTLTALKRHI